MSKDAPLPPLPEARNGLDCFRRGGDHDYCRCLDLMDSARAVAGRPMPELPLNDPLIRYAMRHPELYPIINADTVHCLTPPATGPEQHSDSPS